MSHIVHSSGISMGEPSPFVIAVCRVGEGRYCCRFLVGGADGFSCAKFEPVLAPQIAARHAAGTFVARGDNCAGRPYEVAL